MRTVSMATSVGEALDKLTILALKAKYIPVEDARQVHITTEQVAVSQSLYDAGLTPSVLLDMWHVAHGPLKKLRDVNEKLWKIEDGIRAGLPAYEANPDVIDSQLFMLMLQVPVLNDIRGKLKAQLNDDLGSPLREVKSYSGFELGAPDDDNGT